MLYIILYTFSEGAISFPDQLDKPSRTMLTSESSLNFQTIGQIQECRSVKDILLWAMH